MMVLILNGSARGWCVSVKPRIMVGPEGRVPMFEGRGYKGTLRYRVGTVMHDGKKLNVASAASRKSIREAFDNALKHGAVGSEAIQEAVNGYEEW